MKAVRSWRSKRMGPGWIAAVAVVVLVVAATGMVRADGPGGGDPFTLNFDENGNGAVNPNGTGFVPDLGLMLPDPSDPFGGAGGMGAPIRLTYFLPELVINGDVQVNELNEFGQPIVSDGIRFTDANGNLNGLTADRMIYYSLIDQVGIDGLADVPGFPGNWAPGAVVQEIGGVFQWVPGGGNVYNGISDVRVPEPATVTLLGIGLLGLVGYVWRRRKQVA